MARSKPGWEKTDRPLTTAEQIRKWLEPYGRDPADVPALVLVPLYRAADCLRALLASLQQWHANRAEKLVWLFWDDGSQDPALEKAIRTTVFRGHRVRFGKNERNLGFVRTVNLVLRALPERMDVVLLNQDTEVHTNVFKILRAEAYADDRIATVTPLSNNGSIASLVRFPRGAELPERLTARGVSRAVEKLGLDNHDRQAPTGVGFCLYLKGSALKEVGLFKEIFGRGYGEESEWCWRAFKRGFRHKISTRTFVYHRGGKSFTQWDKTTGATWNKWLVFLRHPGFYLRVKRYIYQDPLAEIRGKILSSLHRGGKSRYAHHP